MLLLVGPQMAKKRNDPPPPSEDLEEAYRGKGKCAMPMGGEPNSDYSDQFESAEEAEEEEDDEKPTPSWARELLHSNRELARSNKEIANETGGLSEQRNDYEHPKKCRTESLTFTSSALNPIDDPQPNPQTPEFDADPIFSIPPEVQPEPQS
ncbi:hypothetical protein QYF36_006971 [Acer negundo]|nr:hypothetical protein QYF36_006971 [Acer negundo]